MWVINQYLTLQGRVGCKQRHEVHQVTVVGHVSGDIRVGPVSSPEDPVGSRGNQRLRERDRVRKRRPVAGDALGTGNFDPATRVSPSQLDELQERRLLETQSGGHPPHVINDERHRQAAQQSVITHEIDRVKMQINVPTQGFDAGNDTMEFVHVRHAAQVFYEVEAHAPEALVVKLRKVTLGKGVVGVCDTAILPATLRNGIDNDGVIHTVATRVHQNRTFQAQNRLQLLETRQWRIRRRIGAIGCVRISVTRTKYMAMSIAGTRGRAVLRRVGIRVRGFAGWNAHRTDFKRLNGGSPGVARSHVWYRNGRLRCAQ